MLQVQDCDGAPTQAWITGETTAGSGIFVFKNAAAANLCLDVQGGSMANGARIDVATCIGATNQLFAAQLAP